MADENEFELSRRRVLGALGTIGVASAGAGLGTSAYFSDQETFVNNRLTAGDLDLKMDWEEHYSNWSDDETTGLTHSVEMSEPEDPENYRRFPVGAIASTLGEHGLWVHNADVPTFMDNTAIEAFPDVDNDASGEFPVEDLQDGDYPFARPTCEVLADVGDDDDGLSTYSDPQTGTIGRTDTDDTRLDDGTPAPLVNLDDVKPGDFGEITFSTHLCTNDAYLWMNAPNGYTADENGVNEPEADDPDEEAGTVELLDTVQVAMWYDNNCDNLPQMENEPLDIMALLDTSGSIEEGDMTQIVGAANTFVELLPTDGTVQAGLMTFGGTGPAMADQDQVEYVKSFGPVQGFLDGSGVGRVGDYVPDRGYGESTPMAAALDLGREALEAEGRPGVAKRIIIVTDGAPLYPSTTDRGGLYAVTNPDTSASYQSDPLEGSDYMPQSGDPATSNGLMFDDTAVETAKMAKDVHTTDTGFSGDDGIDVSAVGITPNPTNPLNTYLENWIASTPNDFFNTNYTAASLQDVAQELARSLLISPGNEQFFFRGSLRTALNQLTGNGGRGIPLDGDRTTPFNEADGITDPPGENVDPENDPNRDPFSGVTTHCFGFSWWVPVDHGNEIQTDSVTFDLGFYAEQARHNDGAGMNNEMVNDDEVDA